VRTSGEEKREAMKNTNEKKLAISGLVALDHDELVATNGGFSFFGLLGTIGKIFSGYQRARTIVDTYRTPPFGGR
jgi:hypothetical protein